MKLSILALALFLSIKLNAQIYDSDMGALSTIDFIKRPCLVDGDGENLAQSRKGINFVAATQEQACLSSKGSPKILVCLADFPDVKFTVGANIEAVKDTFELFFNGKGEGAGDNPHSVRDYFEAMSGGLFTPEFVIMDTVTLPNARKYYGDISGNGGRAKYYREALKRLSPKIKNRLDELDTNDDGKIDGVIIVFPGAGANVGDDEGMHPACWTSATTIEEVTYATQLICPELLGLDESEKGGENHAVLNGIGVYVHEISHMLGLADYYDLYYKAPGMDYWSLMDYGEYCHNGYRPTPYTAYERNFMGWIPLVELSVPTFVPSMKSIADGGSAYVIYNDGNRNEYYILENRNAGDEWSKGLCNTFGSGLMIYHVDYDTNAWSRNMVNVDANRQRMTIIPANGHFEILDNLTDKDIYLSEMRGHLWPLMNKESVLKYWGIVGNNALTDTERTDGDRTAPAATLYNANTDGTYLMHKPITDIAYDDKNFTVSFSFMGAGPETGIQNVKTGSFGDAILKVYTLDGRQVANCREVQLNTLPSGIYVVRNTATAETVKRVLSANP